jgi:hypothetical protein
MLTTMFGVIRDVFVFLAAMLWIAGVTHTAADASRRFANPAARAFWVGVAASLPVIGLGLYLLARPAETRVERRVRRLATLHLERLVGTERYKIEVTAPKPDEGQDLARGITAVPLEAAL